MKKLVSIVLSLTLVVGLLVGMPTTDTKADGTITNVTPNETNVDLLSGNIYDFCANYQLGRAKSLYKRRSDTYFPTMVTFNWDPVSGASNYVLAIADNDRIDNPITYDTPVNTIEVEDLNPGQTYYYRVGCATASGHYDSGIKTFTTTDLPKTITVNKVGNTRDIGGRYVNGGKQRVRYGRVIRGANLDDISDEGRAKLLNVYGIKTDFDLRKGDSSEPVPSVSPLGIDTNLVHISGVEYAGSDKGIDKESNYDRARREVLLFADANNFPIYVHCQIGRDRTGTICATIESLLGMDEMDIYRDYEISYFANVSNNDLVDPDMKTSGGFTRLINFFKNYSDGTMQENTELFLKEKLGITDDQIASIKSNLLTSLPEPTTQAPTVAPSVAPTQEPSVKAPAKVSIKSAKNAKKKSIVVKYKKATNAKGYQVWWATSKKFKKAKKKFTTKLTYKIKKLKKKKTYYVKVRAYNLNGKEKLYGAFSKVKKVKIKK